MRILIFETYPIARIVETDIFTLGRCLYLCLLLESAGGANERKEGVAGQRGLSPSDLGHFSYPTTSSNSAYKNEMKAKFSIARNTISVTRRY